jgi:hypothetical protein
MQSKQNMMHRSRREHDLTHLPSPANASWEKPPSPRLARNVLFTTSSKAPICCDRLLPHVRRDRTKLLDESLNDEKRPAPRKRTLVDAFKMDSLLQLLRTDEFVGTIDPEYHARYWSEGLLQESANKCTVNELMTRRAFASDPGRPFPWDSKPSALAKGG